MKSVAITKEGIIECYGNRAGYVKNNVAVMDDMFQREEVDFALTQEHGMKVIWKEGVYDKLIQGKIEDSILLKSCRIHQLKPEVDMRMKFIGYAELEKKGFGKPNMDNYLVVYDGNIGTNDLEEIYEKLNMPDLPETYTGYSLSKSDVIELYDEDSGEFYYVDTIGFVKIDFSKPQQTVTEQQELQEQEQIQEQQAQEPQPIQPEQNEPMQQNQEESDEFQVETFKISM